MLSKKPFNVNMQKIKNQLVVFVFQLLLKELFSTTQKIFFFAIFHAHSEYLMET